MGVAHLASAFPEMAPPCSHIGNLLGSLAVALRTKKFNCLPQTAQAELKGIERQEKTTAGNGEEAKKRKASTDPGVDR